MTRPRLQLHLSTLLTVSLLASGLVWLNAMLRVSVERQRPFFGVLRVARGWPLAFIDVSRECYYFRGQDIDDWRPGQYDYRSELKLMQYAIADSADSWRNQIGGWYISATTRVATEDSIVLPAAVPSAPTWSAYCIALNAAACMTLLAVAAAAIEWVTQRLKRKPMP